MIVEKVMAEMRAMEFTGSSENLYLRLTTRRVPDPGDGELLIQIYAAGVTPTEKLWYTTTHCRDGLPRRNAIPAHEFSGIVAALGAGISGCRPGDLVFGMNDWFAEGAIAEFCNTEAASVAAKPSSLSHTEAGSTPIGSLTAWQGLHSHAKLQKGERALIHGGAGAVGLFAVQLAKLQGARVIATASAANIDFVKQLGADEVINYRERRFEEAGKLGVIVDTVGGETLERSWNLLGSDGRLVTIAADAESDSDPRVKKTFFIVEASREELAYMAGLFDSGLLKTFVKAEVPLENAASAYAGFVAGNPGKIVIGTV